MMTLQQLKNLNKRLTPEYLKEYCINYFGYDFTVKANHKEIKQAQQVATYIIRERTKAQWTVIAKLLNRHHSNIKKGYNEINKDNKHIKRINERLYKEKP